MTGCRAGPEEGGAGAGEEGRRLRTTEGVGATESKG